MAGVVEGLASGSGSATSIVGPSVANNVPLAPVTGRGVIVLLGQSALGLGSNGVNNIFLTPASGFNRMVVTHLILTAFQSGVTFNTNTISMGTNGGGQIDWLPVTSLAGTVTTSSMIVFTPTTNAVKATWGTNAQVQLTVAGSGNAVTCTGEVWGYYE